ncbi:BZ3500_MvSof-1268-A1-R1_Chr1-3g01766 [Microbotryum saponariae]|uniref:BZ3500_MvSof-1268-A1-R1_Chr1-3g01766 protein n=1 Tax=Microbotryum saponariae TaxID=289078 RepID=A0A2X0KQX7_9BASI|nr:BZ3500_MvSof-1268-A1-R1_Chr1-3g01766 [Microbotryum saponariae]SCZ94548.1 BZ3501_MvSof-1269-A2-R1_Chr1-3g01368 [Microbotryum saponariae]
MPLDFRLLLILAALGALYLLPSDVSADFTDTSEGPGEELAGSESGSKSEMAARKAYTPTTFLPGQVIEPVYNSSLTVGKRFRYSYLPLYDSTEYISVTLAVQHRREEARATAGEGFTNYTLTSSLARDASDTGSGGRLQSWFLVPQNALPSDDGTYFSFIETVEHQDTQDSSKSSHDDRLHNYLVEVKLVR